MDIVHHIKALPTEIGHVFASGSTEGLRIHPAGMDEGDTLVLREWVPAGYYVENDTAYYTGLALHTKIVKVDPQRTEVVALLVRP